MKNKLKEVKEDILVLCQSSLAIVFGFGLAHNKWLVIHYAWLGNPFRHRVDAGGSKCLSCFLMDTRYPRKDTYRFDSNILFEAILSKRRKNARDFERYV